MTRASATARPMRWASWLAAGYFLLHLPFLAPSLEDIDSINFALGLHEFDIVQHQPHPPGYPVYIALGRVSRSMLDLLPAVDGPRADALALAWWSVLGGVLAILGAARLFAAIDHQFGAGRAETRWPVAFLAAAPLFWLCGLRPMSDMPGLAAVLWSQALLVEGMSSTGAAVAGACLAGIAAGIRIQTLALTMPVLSVVLLASADAVRSRRVLASMSALVAGSLLWAVPLVRYSGGTTAYLAALGAQAGEDFAFVDMVWADPTRSHLARALGDTFVSPWASPTLAGLVGVFALLGLAVAVMRTPTALAVMAVAYVPYVVYHVLLQETLTVRYALPVLPLVTWLAAQGTAALPRGMVPAGVIAGGALFFSLGGGIAYGREAHPVYRALGEASVEAAGNPPGGVFAHFGLRRSLQHGAQDLRFVEPRRQYEWMGPFDYWRSGGNAEVWFFADPRRTDLALIDPASRANVVSYAWAPAGRPELGGARPLGVDWYRFSPPRWFVGEGWSLTPEAGGLTHASGSGPDRRPIDAWIRRAAEPGTIMIGGLRLGGHGKARLSATLDGAVLETWDVTESEPSFLRFIHLPAQTNAGAPYGHLRVVSQAGGDGAGPEVTIRQFGVQRTGEFVYGFGKGWHEAESTPDSSASWRWTSDTSVLDVRGTPQPLVLTVRGESAARYYPDVPTVRVSAAGRTLHAFRPVADFTERIAIPVDAWTGEALTIAIESDRVYLPGVVEGTGDTRRLGVRVWDLRIDTVLP